MEHFNPDITPEDAKALLRQAQWDAERRLRKQYRLPSVLMAAAAICILVSVFLPYFRMDLRAPQYPKGLSAQFYVNIITGDVEEIDMLNHYVGMRPLEQAATVERSLSLFAIAAMAVLVIAAIFIHNRWVVLLVLPVILYPFVFVLDLYLWLRLFGQNLDPTAPLSSSVKPFVQPVFGTVEVGNFTVTSSGVAGFWLACLAVPLVIAGLYSHRKAYKPLVDVVTSDLGKSLRW